MKQTGYLYKIIAFVFSLVVVSPAAAQGLSWCQHNDVSVAGHFVLENNIATSHAHSDTHLSSNTASHFNDAELTCHGCVHFPVSQGYHSQSIYNGSTRLAPVFSAATVTSGNVSTLPANEISTSQFSRNFYLPDSQLIALRTLILLI